MPGILEHALAGFCNYFDRVGGPMGPEAHGVGKQATPSRVWGSCRFAGSHFQTSDLDFPPLGREVVAALQGIQFQTSGLDFLEKPRANMNYKIPE